MHNRDQIPIVTDPHQYLAQYEDQLRGMQQQVDQVRNAFAEARVEMHSPDGAVTVVAAAGGRIEALSLTPKADRIGHTALAVSILDTIHRAQAEAARQIEDTMRPLLGEAGQDFLRQQVTQAVEPDTGSNITSTNRSTKSSDGDGDFYGGSILR
jgi:DNA-binding protein YbaB